jgi:hypothetical protein
LSDPQNGWKPFLGFEHNYEFTDKALEEAADIIGLGTDDAVRRRNLRERLNRLCFRYEEARVQFEAPTPEWIEAQIQPVLEAATALRDSLKSLKGMTRYSLTHNVKRKADFDLFPSGDSGACLQGILETLITICEQKLIPPIASSHPAHARERLHVKAAAAEVLDIWLEFTGAKFSIYLKSRGMRFAMTVLKELEQHLSDHAIRRLALNAEYANIWPNIMVKKAPPADFKEWVGKPDKLQYFSPNPGAGD